MQAVNKRPFNKQKNNGVSEKTKEQNFVTNKNKR